MDDRGERLSKPKNAFEIFRFLDKSDCKQCGEKTCLAFAGAVFLGQRKIHECPKLNPEAVERYAGESDDRNRNEQNPEEYLQKLKSEVSRLNLGEAAERVGARFSGGKLTLKILGKNFGIDPEGNLSAEIRFWRHMRILTADGHSS